jgi:hypothetical protein
VSIGDIWRVSDAEFVGQDKKLGWSFTIKLTPEAIINNHSMIFCKTKDKDNKFIS